MSGSFNRLLEAVVRIDVREVTFEAGARRFVAGVGSGVILSKDGLVLTNAHVASPNAVEISITLPSLERVGARLAETPIIFIERQLGVSKIDSGEALAALRVIFSLGVKNWLRCGA